MTSDSKYLSDVAIRKRSCVSVFLPTLGYFQFKNDTLMSMRTCFNLKEWKIDGEQKKVRGWGNKIMTYDQCNFVLAEF